MGTCPDMCPEKERYMRETRNQLSCFEVVPDTERVKLFLLSLFQNTQILSGTHFASILHLCYCCVKYTTLSSIEKFHLMAYDNHNNDDFDK